ncbi:hypothetical protein Poli38472_001099 [Pythium oligandrum]|uniref:NADH:flavin oxidoreductase/NADH oxidase N-terminal domain-containing protein n=1 Tax=Pythium oligandrum TaxID=41045 RepID=A0A8K1CU13_PYTOL|nr:hypothetical protein Poli38472_001099 [Pythium oligandrum]|eukprot:TMW68943.1 hypothetical protein Poli38472_001099 [Pythium oligandrum]
MSTADYTLFTPLTLGEGLTLQNRVVMSPMTRCRCDPETRAPTEISEIYYGDRVSAGLIITEATAISEQGFGWYSAPALYTQNHADAWKKVVDRVHANGGKIFVQLWHMGRRAHTSFNAKGDIVSASAIGISQGRHRDVNGEYTTYEVPRALETAEIPGIVEDFRKSAALAKAAGFDGIEIHAAGGYLIDQFLQSISNRRTDKYGGSFENRARFLMEIIDAVKTVWPSDRIGVRIMPNWHYAQMGSEDNAEMFTYVMQQLSKHMLSYLAIMDGEGTGYHGKCRNLTIFDAKTHFKGIVFGTASYTRDIAEGALRSGAADAIGFARLFITNPDLVERFQNDWPLAPGTEYGNLWNPFKGVEGYNTFPKYELSEQ